MRFPARLFCRMAETRARMETYKKRRILTRSISITAETYPLRRKFAIARGTKVRAEPVSVEICDAGVSGYGEALPYPRYGETVEGVIAADFARHAQKRALRAARLVGRHGKLQ